MGRFRDNAQSDGDENAIDISPLIDCVFILLIFFIVTTVFVEEPGVDVERPQAVTGEMLEKNSILFAVTPKGEVIYGGRDVGVSGVRSIVKRMTQQENLPVIIQADASAGSGVVIRVIDEAKLAGPNVRVSLATEINRS
jgi:biopolymer transport protein ExbD